MNDHSLPAGAFKATCLKLMDQVAETGATVTITKRGRAVAKLVSVHEVKPASVFFGALADRTRITGDIISPVGGMSDPVIKHKRIEAGALPVPQRRRRTIKQAS